MGAFFLVKRDRPDAQSDVVRRVRADFARRGFAELETICAAGHDLLLYRKSGIAHRNLWIGDAGDFSASAGTFLYCGSCGEAALQLFHADFSNNRTDWEQVFGHFCLIVFSAGRLYLLTDRLGTYPVWRNADRTVFSSSFLAVAAASDGVSIDPQCVYEYVFQGASYGEGSPFREVRRLDRGIALELGAETCESPVMPPLPRPAGAADFETCVARNLVSLRRSFDAIAACFGDRIDTALSGGYDSRLTLALLMERGVSPNLHVYGAESDGDVIVAKAIAAAEGFALDHADKSRGQRVAVADFAEVIERNFSAFDGFPADGIFDDGRDLETRRQRCASGELMLNGGGGEVYRNFFYLPDRSYAVKEVLWSFYSQFDPAVCTSAFSERRYHAALGEKVKRALETSADRLARVEVERVYPMFRCRFWMGKNNGVNNTLGWALTPFIDANTVTDAVGVPLRHKNHGRLEAELIRRINPRLAAYPSAYGHGFAGPPPMRRIVKDLATLCRPPFLRRFSYRLRRRSRAGWPYHLSEDYLSRALDISFPYLRRFFNVDRMMDAAQVNRLCTLEYLFEKLQPREQP